VNPYTTAIGGLKKSQPSRGDQQRWFKRLAARESLLRRCSCFGSNVTRKKRTGSFSTRSTQ